MTESWAVRVTTPDWALVMWNPSFSRCLDLEGEVGGGRPGSRGWERGEGEVGGGRPGSRGWERGEGEVGGGRPGSRGWERGEGEVGGGEGEDGREGRGRWEEGGQDREDGRGKGDGSKHSSNYHNNKILW